MLLYLNPSMQRLDRVTVEDWHRSLGNYRPIVDLVINEMHGHSSHLGSVIEGILNGMSAGECRQQRRMNVEYPIGESLDERRREDSHEAGKHHTFAAGFFDHLGDCSGEGVSVGMIGPSHHRSGDTN